jgi:type I restriction enzyme M protein
MKRGNLDEFVECYQTGNRSKRKESERFKAYSYEELIAREKVNLDLIWLKDDSLEDAANLPTPEVIAREIMENLESALTEFSAIVEALEAGKQ